MAKTEGQKMAIDAVLVAKAAQKLVDAFSDVSPVDPEVFLEALHNCNINFDFAHEVAQEANARLFKVTFFKKQEGTVHRVGYIRCVADVSLKEAHDWAIDQGFEMVDDELTVKYLSRINNLLGGNKVFYYRKDILGGYCPMRYRFGKSENINDSVFLEAAHDCLYIQKKNDQTG
jgi:hypothetical protein